MLNILDISYILKYYNLWCMVLIDIFSYHIKQNITILYSSTYFKVVMTNPFLMTLGMTIYHYVSYYIN